MATLVKISRGGKERSVPKAQWDAMVKNKATYGWSLASNLPKEVLSKDKEVENTVLKKLQDENKSVKEENTNLKAQIGEKNIEIGQLKEDIDGLKEGLKVAKEAYQNLDSALNEAKSKLSEVEASWTNLEDENRKLKNEVNQHLDEIDSLKKQIANPPVPAADKTKTTSNAPKTSGK